MSPQTSSEATRRCIAVAIAICFTWTTPTVADELRAGLGPAQPLLSSDPPALVLLVAVDQLRRDRLDPALPGGLGRLAREGRVYLEGALDHAATETCPGHAVMLTGRQPGSLGITGNAFIDRATGERHYCVEDRATDAVVLGGDEEDAVEPSAGRSPRNIRFGGLGGWMKAADPETRVFSVSAKDRAAIAMTGPDAEAAYWIEKDGRFTTSRYYRADLPRWVPAFNRGALSNLPAAWTHGAEGASAAGVVRADDFEGESDERSRTSPHPIADSDRVEQADNLWVSPYLDGLTLDFALTLVEREDLGRRARPDLLAVSLSATDTIGHAYGPNSAEARDALARLDRELGSFLDALDRRFGEGRVIVALTADHGVLELPEWLAATGSAECPVDGGRQGVVGLLVRSFLELHFELTPFSLPGVWLDISGQLTVNRARARAHDVPVDRVVAVAEAWLEAEPVILEAWTVEEIQTGSSPLARLYRNSFDPERSGDLAIQMESGCLIDYLGGAPSSIADALGLR